MMNNGISGSPHKARAKSQACEAAWWYEDWNGIKIYCHEKGGLVLTFRIDRNAIEGWLKRCAAAKKGKR